MDSFVYFQIMRGLIIVPFVAQSPLSLQWSFFPNESSRNNRNFALSEGGKFNRLLPFF